MTYRVEFTRQALKQLKKMDRFDAKILLDWIAERLEACEDPRTWGKGLTANRSGEWRYRVGSYRILCVIEDASLVIHVFSVERRRSVYRRVG